MTLYQKSSWFAAATLAGFLIVCAFNYGRLTTSTVTLRSQCDITAEQRAGLKVNYYTAAFEAVR